MASALCRSRTVYAVNLRGHGPSDWPGTYSIGLMAEDVTRLLDGGLSRVPVDLVGHSLGGLVACQVAAPGPELAAGSRRPTNPTRPTRRTRLTRGHLRGRDHRLRRIDSHSL